MLMTTLLPGKNSWNYLMEEFFEKPFDHRVSSLTYNVEDSADGNSKIIFVDIPGIKPEDVDIKIEGRSLSIKAGNRQAYFTLGQRIDSNLATAEYELGQLIIRIPVREAKVVNLKIKGTES